MYTSPFMASQTFNKHFFILKITPTSSGLANCRYVAHQSDTQGQNAPKGYIARQEMTPEIAHIHLGWLQNGMIWMQSDPSPHTLHTVFFWCLF